MFGILRLKVLFPVLLMAMIAAVSTVLAYLYTREFRVIPRQLLPLPPVHVSLSDTLHLTTIFATAVGVMSALVQIGRENSWLSDARRSAQEYLGFLISYTCASLYAFLATTINYDPQLIAAHGIFATALFLATHAWGNPEPGSWFKKVSLSCKEIIVRLYSLKGGAALLFMLTPAFMALGFVSDRDFANLITQVRLKLTQGASGAWHLENAFPGVALRQPMLVRLDRKSGQLYILERPGRILRMKYPEGSEPEVLLDIQEQLGEVEVENGALGFALHPAFGGGSFPESGYIYLYYTDTREPEQVNRISRFDLGSGDPETAKFSEMPLLALTRDSSGFHNGGSLEFGPDGFLYIALGEGVRTKKYGSYGEVLRGGILRIDIDEQGGNVSHKPSRKPRNGDTSNYFIPNQNPFIAHEKILEEYWAIGFRNPFRISFDPLTQQLWAGEVGSTVWEEVNRVDAGKHYQFPFHEGYGERVAEVTEQPQQGPFFAYEHTAFDRAVIGGIVYRGKRFPDLYGRYVFADSYSAKVFALSTETSDQPPQAILLAQAEQFAQRGISSVVALADGEILITVLGAQSTPGGQILKLAQGALAPRELLGLNGQNPTINESSSEAGPPLAAADAASLYKVNCARCHGLNGAGDGPDSASLGVDMPNFTMPEFHSARTKRHIRNVIEKGGSTLGLSPMMPPWKDFLTETEIGALVDHIVALKQASPQHD